MDYEDDSQGVEDPMADLPWDEDFYDAVDASIYWAVEEAMNPLEERLSRQIAQAFANFTPQTVAPAPSNAQGSAPAPQVPVEPPAKRTREAGVDLDAFDRLRQAFLATQPALPPSLPSPPQKDSGDPDNLPGPSRLPPSKDSGVPDNHPIPSIPNLSAQDQSEMLDP